MITFAVNVILFPINYQVPFQLACTVVNSLNVWNCQKSSVHQKRFGPAEVYKVPIQMTTRSQVLLLNSVHVVAHKDSDHFVSIQRLSVYVSVCLVVTR